jgi:hypothetical protein
MSVEPRSSLYTEKYIYMFMDAAGEGLPVDASSVEAIDMQMRHCAFERSMTEAGRQMLGTKLPIGDPAILSEIENAVRRLRAGEQLPCNETFPAATLGMLWGWHIVSRFGWRWRAVRKDWWETVAISDPEDWYVILPVQFMRVIAEENAPLEKWPHDYINDIQEGRLPAAKPGTLLRVC